MAYIGNSPGVSSQRIVTTVTATAGQTTFTPSSGYTVGYLDVYLNGIKLINGTDYTASNGSTVVLTDAAALDDVVELMAYIPRGLSDGYTKSEADARYDATGAASAAQSAAQTYAAGLVDDLSGVTNASGARTNLGLGSLATKSTIGTADITDGAVTAAKLAAGAAVPSQTGQSGKFLTTDGTNASWATVTIPDEIIVSATQPTGVSQGQVWYDTTLDLLKAYDGTNWNKVSPVIPTISSVSGSIYNSVSSTLTIAGTGFLSSSCEVKFTSGATTANVTVTASSDSSLSVAVPASIYGLSAGTSVSITVANSDNGVSPAYSITVIGLPTGGSITTSGGYRYHTFTSSSTFTVPSGFTSSSADVLIVAGGGGGGSSTYSPHRGAGGGGAGGAIQLNSQTISAGSYSCSIGSGGSGNGSGSVGTNGGNTTFFGYTAIGGGGGGSHSTGAQYAANTGGSGGGGTNGFPGVAGTSGQGNAGGAGGPNNDDPYSGGGGGGAGAAGSAGVNNSGSNDPGGAGGVGINWKSLGTYYAGGGGGNGSSGGAGGNGGGGNGGSYGSGCTAGQANSGGGGGANQGTSASGGSGIVIIRYPV